MQTEDDRRLLIAIDWSLQGIHNMFTVISAEKPEISQEIMTLYDEIWKRSGAIIDNPLNTKIELKEINVIINYLDEGLERNVIPAGEVEIDIDRLYGVELLKRVDALRSSIGSYVKLHVVGGDQEKPRIPKEIPAPIRVSVRDSKLVLLNTHQHIGNIDYPAANRVRESLKETFSDLVGLLPETSNIDTRYVKACRNLLKYLSYPLEEVSIEAFGLNYQLVDKMTKRIAGETSGIVIDQIEHTLVGISVLLNQFQEWNDYLEALALSRDLNGEASRMVDYAELLTREFSKNPSLVDPAITIRLREMIEPVVAGFINADTISAPLVGSLSNVFSLLSQIAIENIAVAEGNLLTSTGAAVSIVLSNFAITMLNKFCPLLSQFQPLKFIIDVQNYILKYYSLLKDATRIGSVI